MTLSIVTTTTNSAPVLEHINPDQLTIATNVRTEVALDPAFVDNIRTNGVVQPIVATRTEDGSVAVRAGQRRTLAAREAGLATIPVYIIDAGTESDRLVQQIIENDAREALGDLDRIAAYRQLELEGLSPTKIAQRVGVKRDVVKASLTVAVSAAAQDAIATTQVSLDDALLFAEFEGDEAALTQLRGGAEHNWPLGAVADRIRTDRKRSAAVAARIEQLQGEGRPVCGMDDEDSTARRLWDLADAKGTPLNVDEHTTCPGAITMVGYNYDGPTENAACADPAAHGHTLRWGGSGVVQSGPRTEEQKEERRLLIERNKAWDAAEVTRRAWIKELLQRKTLPDSAMVFIATAMTSLRSTLGDTVYRSSLAYELMGVKRTHNPKDGDPLAAIAANRPARAGHVTLAVVLGGLEDSTSRESWRHPQANIATYLEQLQTWGYDLSNVERIAARLDS